ncbi:hypothetical protein F2P81_005445 [Scophthalmus maximus]|uniref:Uncharacterized protein n=1 Tax=Scophthalmus maximus TaxID=52904 RepID=A0A6A4T798_SCOMX|nr:hypothetical protein F2P81_005445 [Scophthalmus maximus]
MPSNEPVLPVQKNTRIAEFLFFSSRTKCVPKQSRKRGPENRALWSCGHYPAIDLTSESPIKLLSEDDAMMVGWIFIKGSLRQKKEEDPLRQRHFDIRDDGQNVGGDIHKSDWDTNLLTGPLQTDHFDLGYRIKGPCLYFYFVQQHYRLPGLDLLGLSSSVVPVISSVSQSPAVLLLPPAVMQNRDLFNAKRERTLLQRSAKVERRAGNNADE